MKTININTKSEKYVKTDVQIDELNPVLLRVKVLPPLKSIDVDYYIIQYVDRQNRRYESKKLYADDDDYIVDELSKVLIKTTELIVTVMGFCSTESGALYKSSKIILLFYDKNMRYSVNATPITHKHSHNCNVSKPTVDLDGIYKQHIQDKTYTHSQSVASKEWHIIHDLQKYPSVSVVDSAGNIVVGDVEYISNSKIIIRFSGAFSGKAYLN